MSEEKHTQELQEQLKMLEAELENQRQWIKEFNMVFHTIIDVLLPSASLTLRTSIEMASIARNNGTDPEFDRGISLLRDKLRVLIQKIKLED